jgi:hypothetical protein
MTLRPVNVKLTRCRRRPCKEGANGWMVTRNSALRNQTPWIGPDTLKGRQNRTPGPDHSQGVRSLLQASRFHDEVKGER